MEDKPQGPPAGEQPKAPVWEESRKNSSSAKPVSRSSGFELEKGDVSQKDIFRLAKSILIVATGIYLLMALLRIFLPSPDPAKGNDNMKDVWDYSKVFLNSIISLVLGLYFGAKKEDAKKDNS